MHQFLSLVVGHCLADYPLQGDFLARAKNHRNPIPGVPWYQALTAHAIIQAGFVGVLTGSQALFWCELLAHWLIDFCKSEGLLSYNHDQVAHIVCKFLWIALLSRGLV